MKKRYSITCASYLLLSQDGKVLLLRRVNTGYEDGNYSVPAGHVDEGESVSDALVREAKEEIGLDIDKKNIELAHVMHRKGSDTNDERIDFFFTCSTWNGDVQNMEPRKCDDLSWFVPEELPENVIPYIKIAIEKVSGRSPYSDLGW